MAKKSNANQEPAAGCTVCGKTDLNTVDGTVAIFGPDGTGLCHACGKQFFSLDDLASKMDGEAKAEDVRAEG